MTIGQLGYLPSTYKRVNVSERKATNKVAGNLNGFLVSDKHDKVSVIHMMLVCSRYCSVFFKLAKKKVN